MPMASSPMSSTSYVHTDCKRRVRHPPPQRRQREFTSYKDYVGQDITCLLSVPVWIMEPTTLLQKAAEILEYYQLLNQADETEDEFERCGFAARGGFGLVFSVW